jgi:RNA polymerase sporulation-specific sigma factor
MNYKEYNDYEILNYIADADQDAIDLMYKKYEPLIYSISKKMLNCNKNIGLELNDLIQEGMLGLQDAIDTFNTDEETTFYTYAQTCIKRKILSYIISANRIKKKALNEAVSIDFTDDTGENKNIEYLFKNDNINPENILINEETQKELYEIAANKLSKTELQVFELKASGFNYKEIAEILDKTPKQVDNTIQRIKLKLKKEIEV